MSTLNMTIFYADDDHDDLEIFRDAIESLGRPAEVFTYDGGQKLISALHNPPPAPQVVFLDLNMPGKNGFDALADIRESSTLREIPVIVFSTSDRIAVERSWSLGANFYMRKPTSFATLKNSLREVLEIDWKHFEPNLSNFYISQ
jgi:CheY-like chemotaxis protein